MPIFGALLTIVLAANLRPACPMRAPAAQLVLPAKGLVWAPGEAESGPCERVDAGLWERVPAGGGDLAVSAQGPEGSGRYWVVTVGLTPKQGREPTRGLCFMTSTLGWRSFQGSKKLEWLRRAERDGVPEFTRWDTFQIETDSPANAALLGWVYRLRGDRLVFDLGATKRLAAELSASYRQTVPHEDRRLRLLRNRSSMALDALARGACTLESR